jgi:hypothetical protein
MFRLAVVLASLIAAAACTPPPHQTLTAPSASASEADRVAAFRRLLARGDEQTVTVSQSGSVQSRQTDYLILGDGSRVYYAEDLLPVVAPDSATARQAVLARQRAAAAHPWAVAMVIAFASTFAVVLASPLVFSDTRDRVQFAIIGGAVGIAATGGLLIKGNQVAGDGGERVSAFATYNEDLGKQLDVCVDGTRVVGCAAGDQPPPPATPAAPAAVR